MKRLLFGLLTFLSVCTYAQDTEKKVTVKTYGFVGFDCFVDSRQSINVRGSGLLYPLGPKLDPEGNDLNDKSSFDFAANISRIGFAINGPEVLGASSSAKIEADFAGASGNGRDFVLRLRHAYINLNWDKSSLLVGQTWHPMFVPENYPSTVNFVVGVPFHPLSRAPQVRYNYKAASKLTFTAVMLSQGDFVSSGLGRQAELSGIPEFNFQLKYGSTKDLFISATFGVKSVLPTRIDDNGVKNDNNLTSMHGNFSARYTTPALTMKAGAIYGGNMTNLVMIGGLARKTEGGEAVNGEYEAIRTSSYWTDIHTNGKTWQVGLMAGSTYNLGTEGESTIMDDESIYTRGGDIGKIYIISPRIIYKTGPYKIGLEYNQTTAHYGTDIDNKSNPTNTTGYTNNRIVLGFRYNF